VTDRIFISGESEERFKLRLSHLVFHCPHLRIGGASGERETNKNNSTQFF
jgi:hypothetical protein